MKGIILAAGLGSRLKNITSDCPKALVKVNGIALIDYALRFLAMADEVIVIGGYRFDLLQAHIGQKGISNLSLVENSNYQKGSVLTIEKALNYIDDSFLLMNVDHIYPLHFIDKIANNISGITAICDFDRKLVPDDMKVKLNENNIVYIDKKLTDYDCGYIGMTSCHKNSISLYKDAVKKVINTVGESANVEYILQLLANEGSRINYLDLSNYKWLEVDNHQDLKKADNFVSNNLATFYS